MMTSRQTCQLRMQPFCQMQAAEQSKQHCIGVFNVVSNRTHKVMVALPASMYHPVLPSGRS